VVEVKVFSLYTGLLLKSQFDALLNVTQNTFSCQIFNLQNVIYFSAISDLYTVVGSSRHENVKKKKLISVTSGTWHRVVW
jgi:hypothetical protein